MDRARLRGIATTAGVAVALVVDMGSIEREPRLVTGRGGGPRLVTGRGGGRGRPPAPAPADRGRRADRAGPRRARLCGGARAGRRATAADERGQAVDEPLAGALRAAVVSGEPVLVDEQARGRFAPVELPEGARWLWERAPAARRPFLPASHDEMLAQLAQQEGSGCGSCPT